VRSLLIVTQVGWNLKKLTCFRLPCYCYTLPFANLAAILARERLYIYLRKGKLSGSSQLGNKGTSCILSRLRFDVSS
jgi:hypothetical protein